MEAEVLAEIVGLKDALGRAAAETEAALDAHEEPGPLKENRTELLRQLAALRERVAAAGRRDGDAAALRAELATLLSFATTLRSDAERWLVAREATIKERERQRTLARREHERSAAERELRLQIRDALQTRIVQTAARMVQREGGEWRRTLPVLTVDEGLTICSASVCSPRKGLRIPRHWLVTLNRSRDDVLIRPE